MGCRGQPLFDLNEPPPQEEEVSYSILVHPQKSIPSSNPPASNLFMLEQGCQRISNDHAFTHASSSSVFQPFVRSKGLENLKECIKEQVDDSKTNQVSPPVVVKISEDDYKPVESMPSSASDTLAFDREEGELCDMEANTDVGGHNNSNSSKNKGDNVENSQKRGVSEEIEHCTGLPENIYHNSDSHGTFKEEVEDVIMEGATKDANNKIKLESGSSKNSGSISKNDAPVDVSEEPSVLKPKGVRGVEATHALRLANHLGKRPKIDEHKEAMLGKRRARQTLFIPMEDAKQVSTVKTPTAKRQASSSAPITSRNPKEVHRASTAPVERTVDKQSQLIVKEPKKLETSGLDGNTLEYVSNQKNESNGDFNPGPKGESKKTNNNEFHMEECPPPVPRQDSWKHPADSRQFRNSQVSSQSPSVVGQNVTDLKSGNKKLPPAKKLPNNTVYQDTSIERLLREVTNDNFWRHPESSELQCVPGQFASAEDYVRVFEPLLFEECRAQLHSTLEELTETASRDAHVVVRVKAVERRERGWYDVIALPVHECKWTFKEGDVAVFSSQRPDAGLARSKRNSTSEEGMGTEVSGRLAGTIRRYIPTDTRDLPGVILHFYVGDSNGISSKVDDEHILRKLQPRSVWYLTVLGSLTTTQREYIALHAFCRLNLQMQTAILKPSPEYFPKYDEQPPAMPECFTLNFVDHLHRTFNGPQLAAIQSAAMHTAAGTSSGLSKRQDPWPFTLVQGPPGTGKTHTVCGMLNVIHLVQYQRYYTALLKKLAPESYKQVSENNSEIIGTGSIDEVLQSMDQNLFRTLPKLCPKPRMLVCAPSNAATDELLARVLDRGFIDGEMRVYRPDVARVGVDSQSRAAQAVSVERRTEQLLVKGRDEVLGWLHQLRAREAQFSQQIALYQRELNTAAAAGRSQGSVGVDPDVLVARDHNRDVLLQNLAAAVEGRDKVLVEMSRLLILEKRFRSGSSFDIEDARASLEASFANEAEIVFTTVSSSGRKIFSRLSHGFDMVVIDEAAQASEVAVLPPLSLGAARCVLVGDPQQLPATVISKAAGNLLYSRSLFERFQQAGCPTILLSVQYRMHPQIRDFPSRYFYQGRLTDSESVANLADEAYYKDPLLQPYLFFDLTHGRESQRGGSVSYQNIQEAQFSLHLYEHLQKFVKSNGGKKVSVGIVTPYKLQLKCIQREFEEVLSSEEGKDLYINTVDAFQGQERDVIIMSCVRASNHGVGFVADIRRMNVALTRARRALWVVGNANALMQSDDWAALVTDAKSRKCFMDMDSIPKEFLIFKGSTYAPGRTSNVMRNLRTSSYRSRYMEMHPEPKTGAQLEDDKSNAYLPRNCSYRNLKLKETSMNELGQSGDRSIDASQHGFGKRQTPPEAGRRDM